MKLLPMRVLYAVAPSGGEIRFVKYSESAKELSWYNGVLEAAEDTVFWKAKLAAEKAGRESLSRAAEILTAAGWSVTEGEVAPDGA